MLQHQTCTRIATFWGFFIILIVFAQIAFAQNDQNRPKPTPSDCDAYARNYAERYSGSMLGGAVKGAVRGGIFGAIVGDSSPPVLCRRHRNSDLNSNEKKISI